MAEKAKATNSYYVRRTNCTFVIPHMEPNDKGEMAVVWQRHPDTNAPIRVNGRLVPVLDEHRFTTLPGRREDGEVWAIYVAEKGSPVDEFLAKEASDMGSEITNTAGYEMALNSKAYKQKVETEKMKARAEAAEDRAAEAQTLVEKLQAKIDKLEGGDKKKDK